MVFGGCHGEPPREVLRTRAADGALLAVTRVPEGPKGGPAALLIHGFGQNRYLFDLPARSFAGYLARSGIDTYLLELRGHGRSRGRVGPYATCVADYADLDIPAAVDAIRQRGVRDIWLVGHSMGGVACMAASRELLASMKGVVSIASPTHFGRGAELVRLLAQGAMRLLEGAHRRRRPLGLPIERIGRLFHDRVRLFDLKLPWPVHIWVPGQIERSLLRSYLRSAFDRESLGAFVDFARWCREGTFDRAPGEDCIRERLRSFPAPIYFVAGKQDRLVPPESVWPGYALTRAPSKSWRLFGRREHRGRYGHVDLVLGRHAPVEVWPQILSWMTA